MSKMDIYQEYIHVSRYARFRDDLGRRETWDETVDRYMTFVQRHLIQNNNYVITEALYKDLRDAIYNLEILPSMRALMTAGEAADRDNVCIYNCSYIPIDNVRAFDELLYVLMCGTGVGFSVERQLVNQLPIINEHFEKSSTVIVVDDSKAGWARSLRELIALLYQGQIPSWDTSKLREAGARLKTFGGRSSGPGPLIDVFKFTVNLFQNAAGRKLTSIECHDLVCKIAECVVVGGVRRSALISLSNLSDDRMRYAKSGKWWEQDGQRSLANNSVAYTEKPDMGSFMREWQALHESKSGERGIFNREGAIKHVQSFGRRKVEDGIGDSFGMNPCAEIILRPYQFCNLTEVVIRDDDNFESLARKVRLATILGTFQSTMTNFKYLRKIWQRNCEEERLLGVSITGIMDNTLMNGSNPRALADTLDLLRKAAVEVNKKYADEIGINPSTAITAVKPSGTVSQLVNSASGIHGRYSNYYIRRVRGSANDPLVQFMKDRNFQCEPDVMAPEKTVVFSFPVAGPKGSIYRDDRSAVQQLDTWLIYKKHWTEHNPSITVYVKDHEWMEVGAWVYRNFDDISGISFLPHSNHIYQQAPYQEITEAEYLEMKKSLPSDIDWRELAKYEVEDATTGSQDLACVAGGCEII